MLKFLDGPAAGVTLMCARAPLYLRVAQGGNGDFDALDQLADRPRPGEQLFAYRKVKDGGSVHLCGRDSRGRRFGRWEQVADYALSADQPDDATMRDTNLWRAWATAQAGGPADDGQKTTPPG